MEKVNFNLEVLYEDNHLIAVFKPAGVLVQGDETGDKSLMDFAKEYLKGKYKKEGNVFLGLIHRLDRPVSGVVLFAKTSKGASRLSEQFRDHTIEKIYHAKVEGLFEKKKGTLINYILKDEGKGKSFIVTPETPNAQKAELSYEVVKEGQNKGLSEISHNFSILKVVLKTGRFHQIRCQLSNIGHPIYGDVKYGAKTGFPDGHIELCATSLKFKKATEDDLVTVSAKFPY
ncbi:MAG: RluA family pseudouridine synthase [bacterium]